jgi:hypothetical protein
VKVKTETAPILTISTKRTTIKIDGTPYALRTLREITLQRRDSRAQLARIGELLKTHETLTASKKKELMRLLETFTALVVIAPPAVHRKLTDANRLSIVEFFVKTEQAQ